MRLEKFRKIHGELFKELDVQMQENKASGYWQSKGRISNIK